MPRALIVSPAADRRLARAAEWLTRRARHEEVLIVGATVEAAAELCRAVAVRRGATFGWTRSTLARTAAALARRSLADRRLSPVGPLALEAVAAKLVDRLGDEGSLGHLAEVASFPGLPRALARTLADLRLAEVDPAALAGLASPAASLAHADEAYGEELARVGIADRALVFRLAAAAARAGAARALPILLLDVALAAEVERELCEALVARSPDVLAVAPEGDARSVEGLSRALGVAPTRVPAIGPAVGLAAPGETSSSSLRRLQERLFAGDAAQPGAVDAADDAVVILSAPGESRECVEIARALHREAARGVPFDRMAILLRAPAQYRAHVEEALARAEVPACFARGAVEPDPAGRAFAALLACAAERFSARRFAEYLSLGQVPDAASEASGELPPPEPPWIGPEVETAPHLATADPPASPPIAAAHVRAPRRWERLLVESAVIGGIDRWESRLAALRRKLELDLAAAGSPTDPAALRAARNLGDLTSLQDFALPLLRDLAALPDRADWSAWLAALAHLARRSLRAPERVLALLAELHPMGEVGPVSLAEVRLVLRRRLTDLVALPAERRGGRVLVLPVDAARGLSFDVVFVPGVAERLFPQKVSEDPVLRDRDRASLGLDTNDDRVAAERRALRLAVGAASKRIYVSYPRVDLEQSRPRVPSFYALEVVRAAEGSLPGFDGLARRAETVGASRIGWPAPSRPELAIDDAEYDLAVLERLLRLPDEETTGTARYLLSANAHLARALRFRARRWTVRRWLPADGLVDPTGRARAALDRQALGARTYSPTALEKYAACPYRFLLHAVHGLSPREMPEAIDVLDRAQRGALAHEALRAVGAALSAEGLLPLSQGSLDRAHEILERELAAVAARFHDELAPTVERVWRTGLDALRADLREWLRRVARASVDEAGWTPWRFELSFGVATPRPRDPASRAEPVVLEGGLALAGSIDLVERAANGALRATDYKTGKARGSREATVVAGGEVLQPLLYALALEKLFPEARVELGRLYFCTSTGGFSEVPVVLDDAARAAAEQVAETIGGALAEGFLPAAPAPDACARCDYRVVCGPYEETRVEKKAPERLHRLRLLRALP